MSNLQKYMDQHSTKIDSVIQTRKNESKNVKKLLLLGAGSSGKSTFFKQVSKLYAGGLSDNSLADHTRHIWDMTVLNMQNLIEHLEISKMDLKEKDSSNKISEYKPGDTFTKDISDHINKLWKDPAIQKVWELRDANFVIADEAYYFFQDDTLKRMSSDSYKPSFEDILRVRIRTTGANEMSFIMNGVEFQVVDVGGQRSERRKWIHYFDSVSAVIFVAALSGYDQVMFEDNNHNRMTDEINIFKEVTNNSCFDKTAFILLLNKKDLFEQKIKNSSLNKLFPEYKGGNNYDKATSFLREKFLSQVEPPSTPNAKKKNIYTHITCALDQSQVKMVFEDMCDYIPKEALRLAGLNE